VSPPLFIWRLPTAYIIQIFYFPYTVFVNVRVFIDASAQKLLRHIRDRLGFIVVITDHIECAESSFGGSPIRCDVDNVLHLQVIEQKTEHRTVMSFSEIPLEPITVEPLYTGLALINTVEETHRAILGEQFDGFVVKAHIDIVTIDEMEATDCMNIFDYAQFMVQSFDFLLQSFHCICCHCFTPYPLYS
jgi:hypothetical protein